MLQVGDSAGWTNTRSRDDNVNYNKWALSKSFKVGDTLLFEYNPQIHNVMQVNRRDFLSCRPTDPMISSYSTGKDLISLNAPGYYYFVGANHCEDGLKFEIRVSRAHHNCQGAADSGGFGPGGFGPEGFGPGGFGPGTMYKPGDFSVSLSSHCYDAQLVTNLVLIGGVLAYYAIAY
ncbi:hypothetical protein ACOSQ4_001537 [Xanthoceras sorbifolium]